MADDLYTVADSVADALDLSGNEVSDIFNSAPLLARLPMIPSSNGDTHKYSKYTQEPVVGFRAENAGRDFDHGVDTIVTDTLKILDFSTMTDKAVADRWRQGGASALIARRLRRHLAAALFKWEKNIIYGTNATFGDAAGAAGLFDDTQLDALADAMVLDAGGTAADTAQSCYMLRVSPEEVAAVMIDGNPLDVGDTIVQDFLDGSGKHFPGYYTPACSWVGFQIGGAKSAGRIANLTADSGKGLTDDLLSDLYSLFPSGFKPNLIVTGRRSLKQLQQSRTATSVTGAPAPFPGDWEGIPIITSEAMSEVEPLEV